MMVYCHLSVVLKDGCHVIAQPEEKYSPEELQLMKTQDIKYVQMKLSTEKKVGWYWCIDAIVLTHNIIEVPFDRKSTGYRQASIK